MQAVLLQVLEQGAARAVYDALGFPRRARGVEDVERVIEGQGLERGHFVRRAGEEVVKGKRRDRRGEIRR